MSHPNTLFVVSAIGPDRAAQVFGAFSSEDQAQAVILKLSARLLLFRCWQYRPWKPALPPGDPEVRLAEVPAAVS